MSAGKEVRMVQRHQRVAFMNTGTAEAPVFTRMQKFTNMKSGKNPKEYNRQYVDEVAEESDVVGYAPSIEYSFDRHTNTPVHEVIAKIHDGELVGSDTLVDILIVDLFTADAQGKCEARKRTYSVIPSDDSDGTDALVYSGAFKCKSAIVAGKATLDEAEQIATFEPGGKE